MSDSESEEEESDGEVGGEGMLWRGHPVKRPLGGPEWEIDIDGVAEKSAERWRTGLGFEG